VLAIVPLRIPQPIRNNVTPPTAGTNEIQSWDLRTQKQRCGVGSQGVPLAVATNGSHIGAIVPSPRGHALVQFSPTSCRALGMRPIGGHVQPELAMDRHAAAWVSGRSVTVMDLGSGHVSRAYHGALVPHGLSLSNGRLAWWVTGSGGGSRVLRLALP
jgi:hypothetical protein